MARKERRSADRTTRRRERVSSPDAARSRRPEEGDRPSGPVRALAGGSGEVFSQHGRGTDDPDRYGGPFRRHDDPPIDRSPGGRGSGGYESEHTWGESEAPRADVDRPSDESIRENVLDQLDRHEEIDAAGIEVLVEEGEVTLQGTVADPDMRWLAEGVAESVAGVSLVHNRLRLARP